MMLLVFGKWQDSEYLIIQVIVEYLSVLEKYQFDGISFCFMQVKREVKGSCCRYKVLGGYNIVLFSKFVGVKYFDKYMWEYQVWFMYDFEDESGYFYFLIYQVVDVELERDNDWEFCFDFMFFQCKYSFEMIFDGLIYYYIQGVFYQKILIEIE